MHTTVSTFFIAVALAMSPLGNGNHSTVLITNQLREILYFYDENLQYLVTVIVAIYPIRCNGKEKVSILLILTVCLVLEETGP